MIYLGFGERNKSNLSVGLMVGGLVNEWIEFIVVEIQRELDSRSFSSKCGLFSLWRQHSGAGPSH